MSAGNSSIAKRTLRILGARWLTPILTALGLLWLLLSLVLQATDSTQLSAGIEIAVGGPEITRLMATNPFVALYLIVLLLHLCARWVAGIADDSQPPSLDKADVDQVLADTWRYAVVPDPGDWGDRVAEKFSGWASASTHEGRVVYRRRPSRVPLRLWQAGLLLLFAGLLLSTLTRQSGTVYLGEGQVIQRGEAVALSRYDWRFSASGSVSLPFEALRLDQGAVDNGLNSAFQPRGGAFVRWPVSATVAYLDRGAEKQFTARAFPPVVVSGRLIQVIGIGLGPRVVATHNGTTVLDSFAQPILMPGGQDEATLEMEPLPFTLRLKLLPRAGVSPVEFPYRLELVEKGRGVVASGTVGVDGGSVDYAGWSVAIPETRYWIALNVTKDPGVFLVVIGVLAVVVGLIGWLVAVLRGWESYLFVEEEGPSGRRLYVGVDASAPARGRAGRRFEELLQRLTSRRVP